MNKRTVSPKSHHEIMRCSCSDPEHNYFSLSLHSNVQQDYDLDNHMARVNQNSAYKERNIEFLEEYAQREGVRILFNGVMVREITKGKGDKPTPKAMITVHYTGKLINGKVFDATQQGRPATFKLNQLIDGWRTALREMPVGSRWEIVIPFNLGYGAKGAGVIKPFSTLIFDVRLLAINQ